MTTPNTALILGASGGIGSELALALQQAGWHVRGLKRGLGAPRLMREGIEWIEGDAMRAEDVITAATGCAVIVHAVNPPGYRRWADLVLPMIDNTLAAARQAHATILLPGTVYNYGEDAFPLITEHAPQHPRSRKGAIRVELERRLRTAAEAGDARVIILRAGDYFGARARNSWFSQAMVKAGHPVTSVHRPSAPGVGHQYAYLPDVAQTMLRLLTLRDNLPAFSNFHFKGHWDHDGTQLARAVQRIVTRRTGHTPPIKAFPWWLMRLASPFVTTLREMQELRYLWQTEVRLDNPALIKQLGSEPHTPLDIAIEATLEGLGCLPKPEVGSQTHSLDVPG